MIAANIGPPLKQTPLKPAAPSKPASNQSPRLPSDTVEVHFDLTLTSDMTRAMNVDRDMRRLQATCVGQRGLQANHNAIRNPVMDLFSSSGKQLDAGCAAASTAYSQYQAAMGKQEFAEAKDARERLYQAVDQTGTRVAAYQDSKQRVGDNLATVGEIGVGIVAGVATGGASLVVAAGVGALGAGTVRVAARGSMQGHDYNSNQAGKDFVTGAVDGAASVVGGRAATAAFRGASTAHMVGRGAVAGGMTGAAAGATRAAVEEKTWAHGTADGLVQVARSGAAGGVTGGAVGAVVGPAVEWGVKGVKAGWNSLQGSSPPPSAPPAAKSALAEPAADGRGEWSPTHVKDGKVIRRERTVTRPGGQQDYELQWDAGDGTIRSRRQYTKFGLDWVDLDDGKTFRHRASNESMLKKAAAEGSRVLPLSGPQGAVEVTVNGATDAEFGKVRAAIEAMPAAARARFKNVSVLDQIGYSFDKASSRQSDLEGLAASTGDIFVRRNSVQSMADILQHEVGHNLDLQPDLDWGRYSSKGFWGKGQSVSAYGATVAVEDFAETHRVVMANWPRYQKMDAQAWASESQVAKKIAIAREYEAQIPSLSEIRQAISQRVP